MSLPDDGKTVLINPVGPQFVPIAWAIFSAFGVAVTVRGLVIYPFMSQPWQANAFVFGMVLFAFVSIEGWWFASQREFQLHDDSLRVRRWLDAVLGRPGTVFDLREVRSASLIFDSGKKLELRVGDKRISYWAAIWHPAAIQQLLTLLRERGVETRADWGPGATR
jgi:hypothetical protein